jgi:hypothetical protein
MLGLGLTFVEWLIFRPFLLMSLSSIVQFNMIVIVGNRTLHSWIEICRNIPYPTVTVLQLKLKHRLIAIVSSQYISNETMCFSFSL